MKTASHALQWRRLAGWACFFLIALAAAYYFTVLRSSLCYEFDKAKHAALLQGTAETPFQHRVLVLWLVRWIHSARLPFPLCDSLYHLIRVVEMLSVFFLIIVFRVFLSLFFRNRATNSILAFTIFLILPFNFLLPPVYPLWYPSDIPAIVFFTLGMLLIYRQKWILYYLLFAVATFNRPTPCFLTFIYLFNAIGKKKVRGIALHCAAQLFLWLGIMLLLRHLYRDNPAGRFPEWQLPTNLAYLKDPLFYPYLFSTFGYLWIVVILFYHRIEEVFVRRALLVAFPYLVFVLLACHIIELRVYGELIPLVLTAFFLVLRSLLLSSPKSESGPPGGGIG